jgi:thiol peroxidase
MPQERSAGTTLKGNPFTLIGPELKAGDKAPGFTVVGNDLKDVTLASSAGKVRLISVGPFTRHRGVRRADATVQSGGG